MSADLSFGKDNRQPYTHGYCEFCAAKEMSELSSEENLFLMTPKPLYWFLQVETGVCCANTALT